MKKGKLISEYPDDYSEPERRHAETPRRIEGEQRRYRLRSEALISEFRSDIRRKEDEEGFLEFSSLYIDPVAQPKNKK